MPRHANLPFHLYVQVHNSALGPQMPEGTTRGIWHAAYCRPGQELLAHVLLETGAHWCGIPLHMMSMTTAFHPQAIASGGSRELVPWGGMGEHLEIMHLHYLEGLPCMGVAQKTALGDRPGFTGRHTGIVFDWADGFSRYPQEHKPLNLIETSQGWFMLLPNNYAQYSDSHFTSYVKGERDFRNYRRGDEVYWRD